MELLERQKNKVLNYKIAENIENTFWFDLTLGIFKYGTILRKRPGVPVNRLVPVEISVSVHPYIELLRAHP